MLYIAFMKNRSNLNLDDVDITAKSKKWWNEGDCPASIKVVGIWGALGTDVADVLVFECDNHDDIRTLVDYWRNEVDLEVHPAFDMADVFRRQGMKIP